MRRCILFIAVLCCTGTAFAAPAHIDHIIVGSKDLDRAIAEVERKTGVRPSYGGVHPGRGTRNALISVGPHTYIELYAPNPAEPVENDDVAALKKLTKLTPIGWAVSADGTPSLVKRAGASGFTLSKPQPGSRRLPDGTVLRWSAFQYENFDDPLAPFFIHWDDARQHPARTSPSGCRLVSLGIKDRNAAKLRSAIQSLKLPVHVRPASAAKMTISLRCPKGLITIG